MGGVAAPAGSVLPKLKRSVWNLQLDAMGIDSGMFGGWDWWDVFKDGVWES